jgi:hypothetical protein
MKREIKTWFGAPWTVDDCRVFDNRNWTIAVCDDPDDSKRIKYLPELYEALADAVRETCCDCIDQVYDNTETYDPVEQGCLFKNEHCCDKCRSWIKLLQTVKSGV